MPQRLLLVANPRSGSPPRASLREQALSLLTAAGLHVDLRLTDRFAAAAELARNGDLRGYDALCVVGGDGTLHEVACGLLQRTAPPTNLPLGLIPAGTGNSLAASLGIRDVAQAVHRIIRGTPRPLDVIRATADGDVHYCLNLIGWAAAHDINSLAERLRWLGTSRYRAAALAHVLLARPRPARLVLDEQPLDERFLLVLACNTRYVGSGMLAAPQALTDDGLMDVVLVRRASRWRMLRLIARIHDGSHISMPEVEHHQVSRFTLDTSAPEPLNLDGELKGATPLAAEIMPGAISILT